MIENMKLQIESTTKENYTLSWKCTYKREVNQWGKSNMNWGRYHQTKQRSVNSMCKGPERKWEKAKYSSKECKGNQAKNQGPRPKSVSTQDFSTSQSRFRGGHVTQISSIRMKYKFYMVNQEKRQSVARVWGSNNCSHIANRKGRQCRRIQK